MNISPLLVDDKLSIKELQDAMVFFGGSQACEKTLSICEAKSKAAPSKSVDARVASEARVMIEKHMLNKQDEQQSTQDLPHLGEKDNDGDEADNVCIGCTIS
jgi:hypothetical protein